MKDLTTSLLGIKIKSPIVLGACSLSTNIEKLKELEKAGAGAIVFKSLFEEQIQYEAYEMEEQMTLYNDRHAEQINLFPNIEHGGPAEHILNVKKAVEAVNIPVMASINCIYEETWIEYAKQLAATGIAALELNFYDTPKKFERAADQIEDYQVHIIKTVKKATNLPIQVKISPFYTNPLNVIKRFDLAGADGYVLYNRFLLPGINSEKESFELDWDYSSPYDKLLSIRICGLLYNNVDGTLAGSAGIYDADDVVGLILSGAHSVQMVSAIYMHGPKHVAKTLGEISEWMEKKGYNSLSDFRGKLSHENVLDKRNYTRSQYVDILLKEKPVFMGEV